MNVSKGKIDFENKKKNDSFETVNHIMGIYGQNGSGKTAFIHALSIIKQCLSGESLDGDTVSYIQIGFSELTLHVCWQALLNEELVDIYYDISITKNRDKNQSSAQINNETISIRKKDSRKARVLYTDDENVLGPKKILNQIIRFSQREIIDLQVEKGIVRSQGRSYLFSDELIKTLQKVLKSEQTTKITIIKYILQIFLSLKNFAQELLYVIGIKDIGYINLGILLPFYFHMEKANQHVFGSIPLPINGPGKIPSDVVQVVEKFVHDENKVLKYLIPGLQIRVKILSQELDRNSQKVETVELISMRDGQDIPLKYESAGIKKILSVLHVFIGAYNNPSMIVAIDELDAGVFEYLLGELLGIFQEAGKGQLIFTSHNLRPLEILDKQSVVFTTTNPENRYVHLKNVKNNNLRDMYYRTILLGGQEEEMYQDTNRYELELALRKVGIYGEE